MCASEASERRVGLYCLSYVSKDMNLDIAVINIKCTFKVKKVILRKFRSETNAKKIENQKSKINHNIKRVNVCHIGS